MATRISTGDSIKMILSIACCAILLLIAQISSASPILFESGSSSAELSVTISDQGASGWKYDYSLENTGTSTTSLPVTYMSIGYSYTSGITVTPSIGFDTGSSVLISSLSSTPLDPGDILDFYIMYSAFDPSNTISLRFGFLSDACHATVTKVVPFAESTTPVPEPATLLLLGSGMIAVGVFRKKLLD